MARSFDDPKPAPDKRKMQQISLRPSLKAEIDGRRGKISRSEWIEQAIIAKIKADDAAIANVLSKGVG